MNSEQRLITLEGSSNFRDVGGYPADGGMKVRWGTVYRSGALSRLTTSDWEWLKQRRIAAICDLRSHEEKELAPTLWLGGKQMRQVGVGYDAEKLIGRPRSLKERQADVGGMEEGFYSLFADLLAPSIAGILNSLATGRSPLIVHCTAGQDRTGFAIGVLLTMLGVSRDIILQDYSLSMQYRRPENELSRQTLAARQHDNVMARYFQDSLKARGAAAFKPRPLVDGQGTPILAKALDAIQSRWGSMSAYLEKSVGIDQQCLNSVRDNCLE